MKLRSTYSALSRVAFITAAAGFGTLSAQAKDFKVEIPSCSASKGSIAVKNSNAAGWSTLGANDPAAFLESMMVQSNCFTIAGSQGSASYHLVAGPLTQSEFEAGPGSFSGQSSIAGSGGTGQGGNPIPLYEVEDIGKLLGGGDKMRYAYVDVVNSSGQTLARGFGRNNTSRLDYSHWAHNPSGIKSFHVNKKSLRAGGAMLNAFVETQKGVMSPGFGTSIVSNATPGASSGEAILLSDLFEQSRNDKPGFFREYPPVEMSRNGGYVSGGKQATVFGYVSSNSQFSDNLKVESHGGRTTGIFSGLECILPKGAKARAGLSPGDRVSVSGMLSAGDANEMSDYGFSFGPMLWLCKINGPWDSSQVGGSDDLGPATASVSITDIIGAYSGNKLAFSRKYKDKVVNVTGPLAGVSETRRGVEVRVKDPTKEGTIAVLYCDLAGSQVDKAIELTSGQQVTVKGIVYEKKIGSLGNAAMKNCHLP